MNIGPVVLFLSILVLCLILTYWLGRIGDRFGHIFAAICSVGCFCITLYVIKGLKADYVFDRTVFAVHAVFICVTVLAFGVTAVFGSMIPFKQGIRQYHRFAVWALLGSVVPTIGTGFWVLSTGIPK